MAGALSLNPYLMSDKDLAAGAYLGIPSFLAESALLLEAAGKAGLEVLSMLTTPRFELLDILAREKLVVSDREFELMCGYPQTRSVVGVVARPAPPCLDELLDKARRIIIVEDSTNGSNLAMIFRIARSFAIDAVLVTYSCADPLFRRCARMSKGAVLNVPWIRVGSQRDWMCEFRSKLAQHGFVTAALALSDDAVPLDRLPQAVKLALVMGTEGDGLMPQTVAACDLVVKIPMRAGVDSLNVAAATAVACWQATRSSS